MKNVTKWFVPLLLLTNNLHAFTIMLAPAGDARHPGRVIHGTFERGVALQFAEKLKRTLESELRSVHIVLSHFPGETVAPLQKANSANRSPIDLYLSLHFYEQTDGERPEVALYRFSYADDFITVRPALSFERYDHAHLRSKTTTQRWGQLMADTFTCKAGQQVCTLSGFFAVPFAPLIGITAPALALEAGVIQDQGLDGYVVALVMAIKSILEDAHA